MYSTLWATALCLAGTLAPAMSQSYPGLLDALVANNASQFAAFLQSDSETLQLFLSGQVKTVFAPIDEVLHNSALKGRETPEERRKKRLQGAQKETSIGAASQTDPGVGLDTVDQPPLLAGQAQKVIVDNRPANVTNPTRRWESHALAARHPHQSLLKIASGLGNITNVIKGDIRFDGGLIHITDGYFTIPQSLSSTANATGQTSTFAGLAAKNNLTDTLDTTSAITAFLPSDAAFSSANSSTTSIDTLSNHVVSGVKYLPDLKDGDVLTTRQGKTLRISVRNGIYYVGGARITQANLILDNGVAHVIDKVLVLPPSTVVTGGSTGMSNMLGLGYFFLMVADVVLVAFA